MRAALIDDDGLVLNVLILDRLAAWTAEPGHSLVKVPSDSPVGPGWTSTGSAWTAPTAPPNVAPDVQAQLDELTDLLITVGVI